MFKSCFDPTANRVIFNIFSSFECVYGIPLEWPFTTTAARSWCLSKHHAA